MIKSIVGIISLFIAIYFARKTINKKNEIKECGGEKVSATIVNYKVTDLGNGILLNYPIYKYEIDGDCVEYTSVCPMIKQVPCGTQVKLNYNTNIKKIVEQTTLAADTTMVVACGGIALLALCI